MLFTEISDEHSQSYKGGGQLSTYSSVQTLTFEQQTVTIGQTNAGGQLKQGKTGSGWTDVTSTQWVLVGDTTETTLVSRESVAGKGGVETVYSTVYLNIDGTTLSGDPR